MSFEKLRPHHPAVLTILRLFNELGSDIGKFYKPTDKRTILSVTAERDDYYILTIKFTRTFKRVRFYIPKDISTETVEVERLIKTDNIIRDIGNFYIKVDDHHEYIDVDALDAQTIGSLYIWGVQPDTTRKDEIYKVQGVSIIDVDLKDMVDSNVLYWGIIQDVKPDPGAATLTLHLTVAPGKVFTITVSPGLEAVFSKGRIFIINSNGDYNSFVYSVASKHIVFTPDDHILIKAYLATRARR